MLSECPNRDGGMETPPFLKLKPRLMDTKKKAEALLHMFWGETSRSNAVQCAILCVDEIVKTHHSCEDCEEEGSIELRDWGKVKEHLNNM